RAQWAVWEREWTRAWPFALNVDRFTAPGRTTFITIVWNSAPGYTMWPHLLCPLPAQLSAGTGLLSAGPILVHKLLDKLSVICPLTPSCSLSMPRCDLEAHLKH
ncbi:hypothetical protein M9458_047949, partial [Cirrhinus mrigala]